MEGRAIEVLENNKRALNKDLARVCDSSEVIDTVIITMKKYRKIKKILSNINKYEVVTDAIEDMEKIIEEY